MHVILAQGYPRKHIAICIANKLQISVYTNGICYTTVVPLHVATARDHGDFVCHGDNQHFSYTLDHAHLLVNVVSFNNRFNCEWTCVTAGAYNRNINKRQACKLIWPGKPCYGLQILQ